METVDALLPIEERLLLGTEDEIIVWRKLPSGHSTRSIRVGGIGRRTGATHGFQVEQRCWEDAADALLGGSIVERGFLGTVHIGELFDELLF